VDDEQRAKYRDGLCDNRDSSQDSYDKAIMTVAAGALGLALGFVKPGGSAPVVGKWLIWTACGAFTFSLLSVIYSYRLSFQSFTKQITFVDDPLNRERIYEESPGGKYAKVTEFLNWASFWTLFVGIVTLATFVIRNL
jgi:hypothetical protein